MTDREDLYQSFGSLFSGDILSKLKGFHLSSIKSEFPDDGRSAKAVAAEKILRAVNDGHLSSVEGAEEYLRKRAEEENEGSEAFPALVYLGHGNVENYRGIRLVTFGKKDICSPAVIYLHGGAYAAEALPFHINYCRSLSERIGAYVLLPLYPLAPNHTWRETYDLLDHLYREITAEEYAGVTIMGDSAGGGLAIAFCQYLKTTDLPQPDHLIAMSPWVDVRMTDHDYEPYRPLDPMLDVPGLQTIGRVWAGSLDVCDPRISPAFGDNKGLPKTLLFTGTREIFYPDICDFYKKMIRDGCEAELIVGEGMNHVYPLYGLSESRAAVERIDREIKADPA